jgi:hypothetical protein
MLPKASFAFFAPLFMKNITGCAPSAPDGSSPRGYSRKTYFEYRLKYIVPTFMHQIVALFYNIIGCALSAPDGSSPRGYSRTLSDIDSKNEFFLLDFSVSFM